MSFWDVVWFIVISFAFMAYLMAVFAIIGDLIRDKSTSGVVKAVWFLALIFIPFLTACLYLIVKGSDMSQRQMQNAEYLRQQQEAYIRDVASTSSPAEQVAQAKALYQSGDITESEYLRLKDKALA